MNRPNQTDQLCLVFILEVENHLKNTYSYLDDIIKMNNLYFDQISSNEILHISKWT
jgi:hypothetical protein